MKRRLSLASVPSRRPPAPAAAEASERNDVPGIASASPTNSTARVRRFLLPRRKGHEPPPIAKRKKEPRPGGGSRLFLFLTSEAIEKDSAQRVRHGPGEVLTTQGPREALTPACGSRGPRETLTSGLGYRLRHTIPNPSFGAALHRADLHSTIRLDRKPEPEQKVNGSTRARVMRPSLSAGSPIGHGTQRRQCRCVPWPVGDS
jgi:hypothetical protein